MTVSLVPKAHIVNCVGFECPERGECLRYLRPAFRARKDHQTGALTVQEWASYDIERKRFGDCPHKLVAHGSMAQALARAHARVAA